jgi:hypothetical protein
MKRPEDKQKTARSEARADGRKQMLVYMAPALVKDLKKAALDREVAAFKIVEEAVTDWLQRHRR